MLSLVYFILFAYGLTVGAQNKVSFFHGKSKFTDKLLSCTYCTGFHAGYISALLFWLGGIKPFMGALLAGMPAGMFLLTGAFVASISSYIIDTLVQWVESKTA